MSPERDQQIVKTWHRVRVDALRELRFGGGRYSACIMKPIDLSWADLPDTAETTVETITFIAERVRGSDSLMRVTCETLELEVFHL